MNSTPPMALVDKDSRQGGGTESPSLYSSGYEAVYFITLSASEGSRFFTWLRMTSSFVLSGGEIQCKGSDNE
jgi:hypothetical protein